MSAQHIQVPGEIVVDLSAPFTHQGIYNAIRVIKPNDPGLTVVSLAVPIVAINCKDIGVIDPIEELKKAAQRLYNYLMQSYIQPLWDALYGLLKALGGVFDIKLPVLGLSITDLFDPNIAERIKQLILKWYDTTTGAISQALKDLLDLLGIRWPITFNTSQPEFQLEEIIKSILNSLWGFVVKAIKKVIELIKAGLLAWEAINTQGIPTWSRIWQEAVDAVLGAILDLLTRVPTIQEIYDALVAFAKKVWNKAVVTIEEIIAVIKDFKFFGLKPFDWDWPWNPNLVNPEIDLMRMLNSMLVWMKNFIFRLILQFVQLVENVLEFFGITLSKLTKITIPITLCAVRNE